MDFTKLNDNFDSVTKFNSDMMLAEDESGIKWEKSVEKTIEGNGKIDFQGNRNRPIKSFFLEGFCVQDGTPSPDNPAPIKVNDSVWEANDGDDGSCDLSPIKLCGIGTAKNTYDAQTGAHIKKIVSVDMGALDYTHDYSNNRHIFRTYSVTDIRLPESATTAIHAMCDRYLPVSASKSWVNGEFSFTYRSGTNTSISFVNNNYSDAVTFKQAMAGVKLYYELAEPITEQLAPQPITQRKGTNTITQVSGSVPNTEATAKVYAFPGFPTEVTDDAET